MELRFGEYQIRDWRHTDEPALAKYANNRKVWLNLLDAFPYPYTRSDARGWIERCRSESPATNFAIADANEAIGGIGITLHTDVATGTGQVGYWIAEPSWGKGIATAALRAFSDFAIVEFGLWRLQAYVFAWNPASARVLEKAGYLREAILRKAVFKDGKVIDAFLYARVEDGEATL